MIFLWVVVALLSTTHEALGKTTVADFNHFNIQEEARNCSAARGVARRVVDDFKVLKSQLVDQKRQSATRREQLEACARDKGLTKFSDADESAIAELCPAEYEAWLNPGYRVQITTEDLEEAREGLQTLKLYLSWHCPNLPVIKEAKATSPDAQPTPATSMPMLMPISERLLAP